MSRARLAVVVVFIAVLSFSARTFAQSQLTTITSMNETGTHPFGAYDGVAENISLSNGNVNLRIPLLTFPGRGMDFELAVEYDSKVWNPMFFQLLSNTYREYWWKETRAPMLTPDLRIAVPTLALTISACSGGLAPKRVDWLFTEANGSAHHFGYSDACGNALTPVDSDDSSLIRLDPTNASDYLVRMKDGTTVHFAGSTLFGGGTPRIFSSIVDRNGNTIQSTLTNGQLTAITDTVGRTFSFDLTNHNISYKDVNGTARTITFTQLTDTSGGPITFTHPLGTDCGSNITAGSETMSGTNSTWAITIPNGGSGLIYQVQLDVLGELIKITYPSGGYTRYDYQPYVSSYFVPGTAINCSAVDFREVVAKHECRLAGGNCGPSPAPEPEDTTTYAATIANQANQYMDVLSPDPSGTPNKTTYQFSVPNPYLLEYASLELYRYIYSGSSTLLRTIQTDYNQITISGQLTYFDGSLPIRVTTTLNDISPSLVSKVETDYDTAALANHWTSYQSPIPISNPTEVRDFDYGLVLKRKTDRTWLKTGEYALAQKHILDRSLVTTIRDGSGNQVAQTTNEYDNYTEGISSSGATQLQSEDSYRGNLTAISRWLNTNGSTITTRDQFDDAGNVRKIVDPKLNSTIISRADNWANNACAPATGQAAAYPASITNALGQISTSNYNSCTSSVASSKDQNDINASRAGTTYSYDIVGRTTQVNYPDGGQTTNCYTDAGGSTCAQSGPPFQTVTTRLATPSPTVTTATVHDGLGRVVQTQDSDPEGTDYTDTTYDSLGRVATTSNPHRSANGPTDGLVAYAYDALNRATRVTAQDGSLTTTSYSGNCTTVTDPASKKRTACSDGLGRLTQVTEDPGGFGYVTTYSYNALDDLTNVVQNGSRQRSFVYDSLSRLTQAANPESGTINYTYDANGNLLTKKDARNITTTYSYDALNRLTQKTYSDGTTPSAFFYYDGPTNGFGVPATNLAGRLAEEWTGTSCCASVAGEIFGYDPMGRIVLNEQYTPSTSFIPVNYTYDLAGDLLTATNGEGVTISYAYDAAGRPTGVTSNLVDAQHPATLDTVNPTLGYYPNGALRSSTYGNGLTETAAYDKRLQLCRYNVNSSGTALGTCADAIPSGNVQDFNYGFNLGSTDNGNIMTWTGSGQQSFNRTYSYDSLNRLSTLASPSDPGGCSGLSWSYDAWANRTSQTATGGSCYQQPSTTFSTNNQLPSPYQYDAAGNMTYDGTHTYSYDAENRLAQVDGGSTASYAYDAEGRRAQKTVAGAWRVYIHDLGSRAVTEIVQSSWGPGYIYLGGNLLAEYSQSTTYFVHSDHLGSARLLTGLNQGVAQNLDYLPFGELNSADTGIDSHKFTGKERDSESGLDNFDFRYFASSMGRFTRPDEPFGDWDQHDPQSLNLYSYVQNNPLNRIDPDGHECVALDNGTQGDDGMGGGCAPAGVGKNGDVTPQQIQVNAQAGSGGSSFLLNFLLSLSNAANDFFRPVTNAMGIAPSYMQNIPVGSGAAATLGAGSATVATFFIGPEAEGINITAEGLEHVIERHTVEGAVAAVGKKSVFNAGEDVKGLIKAAEGVRPTRMGGGDFVRVVDAGRPIGIDKVTGAPTSTYTVITEPNGNLVNAYPGRP